jgi:hypothetical protein
VKTIEISDEAFAKLETARRLRSEYVANKAKTDALFETFRTLGKHHDAVWARYLTGDATACEFAEARKAYHKASEAIPYTSGFSEAGDSRQEAIEAIALDLFPPL